MEGSTVCYAFISTVQYNQATTGLLFSSLIGSPVLPVGEVVRLVVVLVVLAVVGLAPTHRGGQVRLRWASNWGGCRVVRWGGGWSHQGVVRG